MLRAFALGCGEFLKGLGFFFFKALIWVTAIGILLWAIVALGGSPVINGHALKVHKQ